MAKGFTVQFGKGRARGFLACYSPSSGNRGSFFHGVRNAVCLSQCSSLTGHASPNLWAKTRALS